MKGQGMSSKVYACYLKDEQELMRSSSGGAYTALTNAVFRNGGTVIACAYDYEDHTLKFDLAKTAEARNRMRGSKYIQADSDNLYLLLERALSEGSDTDLLVVGTPCQIAGAKSWLKIKNRKIDRNIIFCDLMCHGVSSPVMWREYITNLEEEHYSKTTFVTFKDKEKGWLRPTAKVAFENGEIALAEDYAILYRSDDFMRDSCYNCKFSRIERVSDLTIGDFWKIGEVDREFANLRGTSMVLTHTESGQRLFDTACAEMYVKERTMDECLQPNMQYPTPIRKRYSDIHRDYSRKGLHFVIKKYVHYGEGNALAMRIRRKWHRMKYEGK